MVYSTCSKAKDIIVLMFAGLNTGKQYDAYPRLKIDANASSFRVNPLLYNLGVNVHLPNEVNFKYYLPRGILSKQTNLR